MKVREGEVVWNNMQENECKTSKRNMTVFGLEDPVVLSDGKRNDRQERGGL